MNDFTKTNLRVWVCGQSGSGKSYWIKYELVPRWDRVLVVDPLAEYGAHVEAIVTSPAEARAWLVARGAGHHMIPFRLSCVPDSDEDSLAYLALAWSLPSSLVVVEEVDTIASPSFSPKELRHLIQRGRHRRISVVCSTQRPAATPVQLRSQADLLAAFRLTTPLDQEAVKFAIGEHSKSLYLLQRGDFRFFANSAVVNNYGLALPVDKGVLI